jgi:hypothetical protein
MKTKTFFVVGLFALFTVLFTGCSSGGPLFNKTSHTDVTETARATASNTQTIERVVVGEKTPPITVNIQGTNNVANVTPAPVNPGYKETTKASTDADVSARSDDHKANEDSVKLPKSIAMLIAAVACVIFAALIWYAKHSSAAAAALFSVADNGAAKVLTGIEARLSTETNVEKMSMLNAIKGDVEKHRGSINGV